MLGRTPVWLRFHPVAGDVRDPLGLCRPQRRTCRGLLRLPLVEYVARQDLRATPVRWLLGGAIAALAVLLSQTELLLFFVVTICPPSRCR